MGNRYFFMNHQWTRDKQRIDRKRRDLLQPGAPVCAGVCPFYSRSPAPKGISRERHANYARTFDGSPGATGAALARPWLDYASAISPTPPQGGSHLGALCGPGSPPVPLMAGASEGRTANILCIIKLSGGQWDGMRGRTSPHPWESRSRRYHGPTRLFIVDYRTGRYGQAKACAGGNQPAHRRQVDRSLSVPCGSFEEKRKMIKSNEDEPPMDTNRPEQKTDGAPSTTRGAQALPKKVRLACRNRHEV